MNTPLPKWVKSPDKRLDRRLIEVQQDLEDRFRRRIEDAIHDRDDPTMVGAVLAEDAVDSVAELCEEIIEDGGEGWVT